MCWVSNSAVLRGWARCGSWSGVSRWSQCLSSPMCAKKKKDFFFSPWTLMNGKCMCHSSAISHWSLHPHPRQFPGSQPTKSLRHLFRGPFLFQSSAALSQSWVAGCSRHPIWEQSRTAESLSVLTSWFLCVPALQGCSAQSWLCCLDCLWARSPGSWLYQEMCHWIILRETSTFEGDIPSSAPTRNLDVQEACYTSSASVGFPASGLNTWLCPFHILGCAGKFLSVPSQICIFSEIILHTPYTAALTCLKGVDVDTDVVCDCFVQTTGQPPE